MPKTCAAVGCKNHNMMGKKLSFFTFPKHVERQKMWLSALKRDKPDGKPWEPTKHSVICADHFITGKPQEDPDHPDYVPSVFEFAKKNTTYVQQKKMVRYENKAKRKIEFESIATSNKKVKESPEEMNTAVLGSPTPTQQTPQKNTCGTSPISPWGSPDSLPNIKICTQSLPQTVMQKPITPSEREKAYTEMFSLRGERDKFQQQVQDLQTKIEKVKLSSRLIENNDNKSIFYTGVKWDIFLSLFSFIQTFINRTPLANKLSLQDQLFVTLVKLRLDMPFEYLADQCGIPISTLHDMFWRWINILSAKLDFLIHWPDRETVSKTLPSVFRNKFPRLTCIIDCFEIFIERPRKFDARAKCYSNYKNHNTVKIFIACSPLGSVTFVSTVWGGRVSDTEIVRSSGFLSPNLHLPGDQILADRGFTLQDDLASVCSAELIIPAFTKGKKQLSAREVEKSRNISSVRIHVERIIGLMKNRYKILQGILPINMIKSLSDEASNEARIDNLIRLCASLTNLSDGIVYNEDE